MYSYALECLCNWCRSEWLLGVSVRDEVDVVWFAGVVRGPEQQPILDRNDEPGELGGLEVDVKRKGFLLEGYIDRRAIHQVGCSFFDSKPPSHPAFVISSAGGP